MNLWNHSIQRIQYEKSLVHDQHGQNHSHPTYYSEEGVSTTPTSLMSIPMSICTIAPQTWKWVRIPPTISIDEQHIPTRGGVSHCQSAMSSCSTDPSKYYWSQDNDKLEQFYPMNKFPIVPIRVRYNVLCKRMIKDRVNTRSDIASIISQWARKFKKKNGSISRNEYFP